MAHTEYEDLPIEFGTLLKPFTTHCFVENDALSFGDVNIIFFSKIHTLYEKYLIRASDYLLCFFPFLLPPSFFLSNLFYKICL